MYIDMFALKFKSIFFQGKLTKKQENRKKQNAIDNKPVFRSQNNKTNV